MKPTALTTTPDNQPAADRGPGRRHAARARAIWIAFATCMALLISAGAAALEKEAFSESRFEALQAEGALVLVDIFATWCPTCAEQQRVLQRFSEAHPDIELHILEVDYDRDKQWVSAFRAPRQSTLVLYRGTEQVWFSVAETREEVIFEAITQAAARTR